MNATDTLLANVDSAARVLWTANVTEPYDHREYVRADSVFIAHLTILTGGDVVAVHWLRDFWSDNQEGIRYALGEYFSLAGYDAENAAELDALIAAERAEQVARDALCDGGCRNHYGRHEIGCPASY